MSLKERLNLGGLKIYAPLIGAIAGVIAGLALAIKPEGSLRICAFVVGLALLIMGVVQLINAWRQKRSDDFTEYLPGILMIVAGIAAYSLIRFVVSIIPFVAGVILLICGVTKFMWASEFQEVDRQKYKIGLMQTWTPSSSAPRS